MFLGLDSGTTFKRLQEGLTLFSHSHWLNRSATESRTNTSFTVTVDKQLYDSSVFSTALKDLSGDDFIGKLCSSLFIFVVQVWYY